MNFGTVHKLTRYSDTLIRVYACIDVDGVEEEATMEYKDADLPEILTKDGKPSYIKNKTYAFIGTINIGGGDTWRFYDVVAVPDEFKSVFEPKPKKPTVKQRRFKRHSRG
jgi:hypothetical protein